MNTRNLIKTAAFACIFVAGNAFADRPAKEVMRETVPVREQPAVSPQPVPAADTCGNYRLSYGQNVFWMEDADDDTLSGIYFDYWCSDVPLNFRVGAEVAHIDLKSATFQEFPGKQAEATYVRIPFSLEYYHGLSDSLTWFVGLGPQIINLANDASDTAVGLHISTRLHYAFNENWGAAVEGGYTWDELEDKGEDISLEGWYVSPQLSYTF